MKRLFVLTGIVAVACVFTLITSGVHAESYPEKPIQLVIPMPAGAAGDVTGRLLAGELGKILNTEIVVLNKPGASFTLGTDFVARSKNDGYTIAYTNSPAIVYARASKPDVVPYDPDKDLDPLGVHLYFPVALAVQASSPWKTFEELVAYAKANPGKLRVSTAGRAGTSTYIMEITASAAGVKFTQIPYKGGQAVITALLGGHVEVSFDIAGKFIPHVKAGKLRLLMVSKKLSGYKDVPTLKELGYNEDPPSGWFALYGPAGLPGDVKKVLVPAIEKASKNPEIAAKLEKLNFIVEYGSPEELRKLAKEDYDRACAIAVKLGLRK